MKRCYILSVLLSLTMSLFAIEQLEVNIQAGQLSSVIKPSQKYTIEFLLISGSINGDDILFLREMMGSDRFGNATNKGKLSYLDLSKAQIVRGGRSYYRYNSEAKDYYTADNIIGDAMFIDCSLLVGISLPNNVREIGWAAFYGCPNLRQVIMPDQLISIGKSVFMDCSNLSDVNLPMNLKTIGEDAFRNTGIQQIVIPESVTRIDKQAFAMCSLLQSVKVESSLDLPENMFYGCENLSSVELSNGIKKIGDAAFQGCKKLVSINIPNSLTAIGKGVFYNCHSLKSINLPDAVSSFGEGNFYMCTSLTEAHLPASINGIPASTFAGCSSLREVNIPRDCKIIGDYAFLECKSLNTIYVESTTIPKLIGRAFANSNTNCVVEVPKGTLQQFKNDSNWGYFNNFRESSVAAQKFVADELTDKATKGNVEAQYELGIRMLNNNMGYTGKESEGFAWLLKAARNNHVKAQTGVGYCYHFGVGTAKDFKKAVFWYTKAANAGDAAAQCNLGKCYIAGEGVAKNKQMGINWYKKAARNGSSVAKQNLNELGVYNY